MGRSLWFGVLTLLHLADLALLQLAVLVIDSINYIEVRKLQLSLINRPSVA